MDNLDREIRAAIAARCLLEFVYEGHSRIVEPHDYGLQHGVAKLLAYQRGGTSRSGRLPSWRLFLVSKMSDPSPTRNPFAGAREVPGEHMQWDRLYASVSKRPVRGLV